MTLDEVLPSLFPSGHKLERGPSGTLHGTAKIEGQGDVTIVGIVSGTPLGVDSAILLSGHVLAAVEAGGLPKVLFGKNEWALQLMHQEIQKALAAHR